MNKKLRTSIAALVAGAALGAVCSEASAITVVDLGAVTKSGQITTGTVPNYAWDGWNGIDANLGWAHNSKWYTFSLPAAATVQITMTSSDNDLKPAFSLWQTTGNFIGTNHLSHSYNQVSLGGASAFLTPQTPGGDGATDFVGYVNAGTKFRNGNSRMVYAGTPNTSSTRPRYAALARTLSAGQYLIVLGGSCNDQNCGAPGSKAFRLRIRYLPIPGSSR